MRDRVRELLEACGATYAQQAGIRLADQPAPLYRLLVLSVLLSTRIKADIAVAAARELIAAGCGTPRGMRQASWQDRVDALGRGHYVRYDESTATALGEGAQLALDTYRGDLRRLRQAADGDRTELAQRLQEFPRLGPVGVAIFCREAQDGRNCGPTWTGRRWTEPGGWTCRPTRSGWPGWCPATSWPRWRRRWSGRR